MDAQRRARPDRESRKVRAAREQAIIALANRQHGVIARHQLLSAGFGSGAIARRVEAGRLHRKYRGVYSLGQRLTRRGHWMAAVLACGDGAVLSHISAASLWGLIRARGSPAEVTATYARRKPGIVIHGARMDPADRTVREGIPVTSLARTLFDLAEVVDEQRFESAFEEADRLRLLKMRALEDICARSPGRRALKPIRRLMAAAREPVTVRSPLEERFSSFCRERGLPTPVTNALVFGYEVDALWPSEKLIVELDGFAFHRHRAAFERDRARDARLQAAGYRVLRVTHRRLEDEPNQVAGQIRGLLGDDRETGVSA